MTSRPHTTISLGDLVASTYDRAAKRTKDPKELSRVAMNILVKALRRTGSSWSRATPPASALEGISLPAGVDHDRRGGGR